MLDFDLTFQLPFSLILLRFLSSRTKMWLNSYGIDNDSGISSYFSAKCLNSILISIFAHLISVYCGFA